MLEDTLVSDKGSEEHRLNHLDQDVREPQLNDITGSHASLRLRAFRWKSNSHAITRLLVC